MQYNFIWGSNMGSFSISSVLKFANNHTFNLYGDGKNLLPCDEIKLSDNANVIILAHGRTPYFPYLWYSRHRLTLCYSLLSSTTTAYALSQISGDKMINVMEERQFTI